MRLVFPICESPSIPTLITTLESHGRSVQVEDRLSATARTDLFCSAPISPFGLEPDVLGPAFAVGVGELDEADADMCQTRAGREGKGERQRKASRDGKGKKQEKECSRCSCED